MDLKEYLNKQNLSQEIKTKVIADCNFADITDVNANTENLIKQRITVYETTAKKVVANIPDNVTNCPKCSKPMLNVKLGNETQAKYCKDHRIVLP